MPIPSVDVNGKKESGFYLFIELIINFRFVLSSTFSPCQLWVRLWREKLSSLNSMMEKAVTAKTTTTTRDAWTESKNFLVDHQNFVSSNIRLWTKLFSVVKNLSLDREQAAHWWGNHSIIYVGIDFPHISLLHVHKKCSKFLSVHKKFLLASDWVQYKNCFGNVYFDKFNTEL